MIFLPDVCSTLQVAALVPVEAVSQLFSSRLAKGLGKLVKIQPEVVIPLGGESVTRASTDFF
jgi:hypothetical protein